MALAKPERVRDVAESVPHARMALLQTAVSAAARPVIPLLGRERLVVSPLGRKRLVTPCSVANGWPIPKTTTLFDRAKVLQPFESERAPRAAPRVSKQRPGSQSTRAGTDEELDEETVLFHGTRTAGGYATVAVATEGDHAGGGHEENGGQDEKQ
ncbi:hypothetical protein [Mycetocola zhadangensis]|uniref:Uncharacterized protein n=1 Tax=Mycetocola zhadangensis TaxID=1164595 RepID=A0A3L7ITG7_9MICO|nr:hypothetical protein [Mycetocola zhadangensis]RLQ81517.1 hypothetical protein D9V28_14325 [Mycetocola zhadangensis]RLQ82471.1 hypothetical protein D9V28_10835 [Mycetocola zhadangensis]GGF01035.1 hypothetical protein GCM10011313_25080 [Mycetocola zhadangensis]